MLGWVIADDDHAGRLMALTGITPDELRERLGEPAVLVAVCDFVLAHEPDLIAAATALATTPEAIVAARHALAGEDFWE